MITKLDHTTPGSDSIISVHAEIDLLNTTAWDIRRSDLRKSFELALQAKELSEKINYTIGIAGSYKVLGYCYWRFSDFHLAMNYSIDALRIYVDNGDKKGQADVLNNIGAVYMFQQEHLKRLDCNLECLKLRNEIGDVEGVAGSQNNIGETYFEMGDLANAEKWFHTCLDNPNSSDQIKAWATHNLGKCKHQLKNWNEAEAFYVESLSITLKVQYDVLTTETFLRLSDLLLEQNKFEKTEEYAQKALVLSEKIGAKDEQKDAYNILALINERTGKFNDALVYFKKYHKVHKEIFDEAKNQKIRDIEFQHEIERISREAEIERLRSVELKKANEEIEKQKELLQKRNHEILDSIRYARRIQQALLKDEEHVSSHLPEHFILYLPKDIVSGDFYWTCEKQEFLYVAVADCTGHGVPGGFLTMLGTAYLNEITISEQILSTGFILNALRNKIMKELSPESGSRDGMDISLIRINLKTLEAEWSGANNPLWIFRNENKTMEEFKPDKQSIGYSEWMDDFKSHSLQLKQGDRLYMFSDGYADQFGGDLLKFRSGKKFKYSRLMNLLKQTSQLPVSVQKSELQNSFTQWKGNLDQVDDVCVVGIKF